MSRALARDISPDRDGRRTSAPSRDESPTIEAILRLQRVAGNQAVASLMPPTAIVESSPPIQRVKDSWGVKLSTDNLELADAFREKHVATDAQDAIDATKYRFAAKKMPEPMIRGRLPNTVATSATWLGALDASETVVDTGDKAWTRGVAMAVPAAWQVVRRGPDDYAVTEASALALAAGGYGKALVAGGGRNSRKQVVDGKFLVDHIAGR